MNKDVELKNLIRELMISKRTCFAILDEYYRTHRDITVYVILKETRKTIGGLDCRCSTIQAQSLLFNQH
jgi:hypothetical protein